MAMIVTVIINSERHECHTAGDLAACLQVDPEDLPPCYPNPINSVQPDSNLELVDISAVADDYMLKERMVGQCVVLSDGSNP